MLFAEPHQETENEQPDRGHGAERAQEPAEARVEGESGLSADLTDQGAGFHADQSTRHLSIGSDDLGDP